MSDEDFDHIFKEIDVNKTGLISKNEIANLVKKLI